MLRLTHAALAAALLAATIPAAARAQEPPGPNAAAGAKANTLPLKAARTHEFTTTQGTWISLDVSPDGKTIVFDMLGDLYTMPITGGTATALTTGLPYDAQPRFSPDGKRIAFVSDRSGGDNVWIMSLDKKDTVQLTKGNDNLYVSPEWTPDGQYIVASKSGGLGGTAKLWMYNVNGGTGVALVHDAPPQQKMLGAAFDKTGRYIWYAARQGDWQYNAVGPQYELYVYDRENGKTSQMTTRGGSAFRPALSPDGKYLVYGTRFETKTGLRIRNLETQQEDWLAFPVQRDEQESRAPLDVYPGYAFTPDSKAIVVTYGGEIWRVPVDKTAPTKIPFTADVKLALGPEVKFKYRVDTNPTFTAHQVRDIAPSPDGKKLAFSSLDRIYVMDLPNGTPERVSKADVGEYGPVWAPDGKSLAFVTWSDQNGGQIMRATWTGAGAPRVTQLTRNAGLYSDLAWSPSGDRIVAVRAAAREMQEAGAAFFGPAASEFIWVPATGGGATLIMPTAGLGNPHFTTNPDRIYAYGRRDGLVSFRWDGTDMKSLIKVTGPMPPGATIPGTATTLDAGLVEEAAKQRFGGREARPVEAAAADPAEPQTPPQPPAASLVMMAPKGDQAFALVGMDIYTVTVPEVGPTPATVSVANPAMASMPVKKLNDVGGEFPAWTSDGRHVMWALANAVWTYDLDRAKVVEDSLAADAKAKAAARGDSAAPPRAPTDSAKADSTKKEKPGYKPVEQRIVVTADRDTPRGTILLRGGKAITMKGNEIIENADVLVKDNRIVAIGKRGSVQVPSGAHVIDVTGKTIMPGFVDTHYHPQWLTPNIHTNEVWQYLAELAYGTTTTRDPQTSTTDFLTYGDRVDMGEAIGPRIYTTGPGVFSSENIKSLDQARTILERYAKYYDTKTLKMYMTGNRMQREWVIMAAKELGLMPTTEGGLDFKLELTHGIDGYPGVEHTLPITPKYEDVFQWYKGTQLTNSPTLIVEYGGPFGENWFYQSEDLVHDAKLEHFTHPVDFDAKIRRRGQGAGGSPGPMGYAVKDEYAMWQHAKDIAKTVAEGGRIGVGSHGQLQGLGMHWEMWLLQSGGLSQHDVLRAATIVGAEAIGMGQDLGSLEPGKLADILVLNKDPLVNIRNTNTLEYVMKNGRVYDANTLDEVWPRQRKLAPQQWMTEAPAGVSAGIRLPLLRAGGKEGRRRVPTPLVAFGPGCRVAGARP
ncbi:MAG TPA: amidohydrolase family protein [Gemmatimonadaceae bacterium]|nr:amidohydrolase family protein [Gemmatimonadaceae bacterium]